MVKATSATKSGFLAAWLAPFIGVFGGITAHWLIVRAAPTERERRVKKFAFTILWVFVLGWCVVGLPALRALGKHQQWGDQTLFGVMAGFWAFYGLALATLSVVMLRKVLAIRQQHEEASDPRERPVVTLTPGRRIILVTGVYLACFWGLIYLAWKAQDPFSAGIIAALMVGLGISHFTRTRGRTGVAAMRTVIGHLALGLWVGLLILMTRPQRKF